MLVRRWFHAAARRSSTRPISTQPGSKFVSSIIWTLDSLSRVACCKRLACQRGTDEIAAVVVHILDVPAEAGGEDLPLRVQEKVLESEFDNGIQSSEAAVA